MSDASTDTIASTLEAGDASPSGGDRICQWCHALLPPRRRGGGRPGEGTFCSRKHRQAHAHFRSQVTALAAAGEPKRLAIADPPYPRKAYLYRRHPDYAGEVDHRDLIQRLDREYDGWALATSDSALPELLLIAHELGIKPLVAVWFRSARGGKSAMPRSAFEAVLYKPARPGVVDDQVPNALVFTARARWADPKRVIGAKPSAWSSWVFGLLQARVGDQLDDLFPGSGGVGRAWGIAGAMNPLKEGS